jgi:hypothetical protein
MTITLGNVIQIGVIITAVYAAYSKIRERLVRIETRLAPLWREYERRQWHRREENRS